MLNDNLNGNEFYGYINYYLRKSQPLGIQQQAIINRQGVEDRVISDDDKIVLDNHLSTIKDFINGYLEYSQTELNYPKV